MLKVEAWMDIKILSQQGHSIRAIGKLTGYSRNTIRRVLRQKAPEPFHVPSRASKLDTFKPYVEKRYQECALLVFGFSKRSGRWDIRARSLHCVALFRGLSRRERL